MPNRKDLGMDIAYIAPNDPSKIPDNERIKHAENTFRAVEEIHSLFSKYESHIFMSALCNTIAIGAVGMEMRIEDLLRFVATCYQNANKSGVDKE